MNSAIIPSPAEDPLCEERWMSVHNRYVQEAKEKEPDILFIGDDIIQQLINTEIWTSLFEPLHCLNFGITGDQTQNVLWRLHNGELDFMHPKFVIVHVGTNNVNHTAEQIVSALLEICSVIRQKQPDATVVLTTLLPRGQNKNYLRDRNANVNELLKKMVPQSPKVELINIDRGFVHPNDGKISHLDMYDYLHLTNAGYKKAFEPVYDFILGVELNSFPDISETNTSITNTDVSCDNA